MIGLWIDSLSDTRKDRIVEGKGWTTGKYLSQMGERCLIGHAVDYRDVGGGAIRIGDEALYFDPSGRWTEWRFDALARRFGLDRIVKACKLRAAATMSSEVERAEETTTPSTETASC